jgi:signal transduction histidine kinase
MATFVALLGYLFWRSTLADIDRELAARTVVVGEGIATLASGALEVTRPDEFRQAERSGAEGPYVYGVWNPGGELVERYPADAVFDDTTPDGIRTRGDRREHWHTLPGRIRIVVGRDVRDARARVAAFAGMATLAGAGALVVSFLGGWILVGRTLGPIARISRTAAAMTGGDLSARVAVTTTDSELEQLGAALNSAFDRMSGAMQRQQQFAADASHELRTPLSTILTETEWALGTPRREPEYTAALASCRRAAMRMVLVVDRLLSSARDGALDAGGHRLPLELHEVVGDVVHFIQPMAEKKGVVLESRLDAVCINGDQDRLTDAVINLVANAVEYTDSGGSVVVEVGHDGLAACLRVRDTGRGIAESDLPFVFERFYRGGRAHTEPGSGVGLGLSIARDVVEAHGGQIACTSRVGRGTEFTVTLPVAG